MMRPSALLAAGIVVFASSATLAQGPTYRFGTTPSAEEVKARDTAVLPSGAPPPPGRFTVTARS
jgi:hypothetical protein